MAESCTPKFIFLFEFARMLHTYLNDVVLYRGECVHTRRIVIPSSWYQSLSDFR